MIPLLSSEQMRRADARAVARRSTAALVHDAGTAVALEARAMLGRCYGARVAVLVGPGLNGADGRVAAAWLASRGARVEVIDVAHQPGALAGFDLIVDAGFALGCRGPYDAPHVGAARVLAVDLPSGVDADSGAILGSPLRAEVTLALGALKPAHVSGAATRVMGEVHFAPLGIVEQFEDGVVEDGDLTALVVSDRDDHKWQHAIQANAGSASMPGAGWLVARGALVGGASMIRMACRDDDAHLVPLPPEVVRTTEVAVDPRCRAVVAGPGLGPGAATWLAPRLAHVVVPVVLDADGLDRELVFTTASGRGWILTPHDGEFSRLSGGPVPENRLNAVRDLARASGCVVLLKGPTTIVADPSGTVRVVRSGTPALASAGTGDVLAGLIAATLARGHGPLEAAALSAHLHGRAGADLPRYATASALPDAIARRIAALAHPEQRGPGTLSRGTPERFTATRSSGA